MYVTTRLLQSQLQKAQDTQVSIETIRQRLLEGNLCSRIAARGPALIAARRRARLNFAVKHVSWGEADWERVLWTDELRFCLHTCDRRVRGSRRPNERFSQCSIVNTTLFGGSPVMVFRRISFTARTYLVILDHGNLSADRYVLDILQEHVVPFEPYIGNNFCLMQNNA